MALKPVVDTVKLVNKNVTSTVNQIANTANTITGDISKVTNALTGGISGTVSGLAKEGIKGLNVISDTLRDVNKNLTNIIPSKITSFLSESVKDVINADIYKATLSTFNSVKDSVSGVTDFIKDGISSGVQIFNVGREVFGQLNNIRKTFTQTISNTIRDVRNLFDTDFRNPLSLGNKVLRNAGINVNETYRSVDQIKRELDNLNIRRIKRDVNRNLVTSFREPLADINVGVNEVRNNRDKILNKLRGKVDDDIFNKIQSQLDGIVQAADSIDQNDLARRVANFERFVNDNVDGSLTQELTDQIILNGYDASLNDIYISEKTLDLLDDYLGTKTDLRDIRDLSNFLTEKYGCDLGGEVITDDVINASNFSADQNFYNNLVKYLISQGLYRHLDCILRGGEKKHNNRSLHNVLSNTLKDVTNKVNDVVDDVVDAATIKVMIKNDNIVYDKNKLTIKLLS